MTKYLSSAITTETKAVSFSTEFPLLKSGYYLKQKENIALRVQLESGYDQYIQQKQNIIEQVVQSFFNLYLKKRDLEIAEKDYEFQKHLAEIIENKYKAGSFSRIEVDRIELEMLMSEQKIKLLKNSLFEMEKKFFVMIGTEAKDYDLGINLDSFNIQPKQITSDLINEIINKNIDLKTLDNNKKLLLMERENLNFFNQSNIFCNASFKNENDYSAMSGVKIFLPDFVQDKSKKHLLDIQIKQHENSVLQAKNSLDENITAIKTSFEEYDFNIEIAKKSIAIAKKILEIDQLNYEKGSLPQDKLLESQQRYQQEILNMEKYKIDAILSTIKLDKLLCNVGKEDYILWLKQ
jgi:outer membrane protein TolC